MSAQAPKEQCPRSVASYFPSKTDPPSVGHNKLLAGKMASEASEMEVIDGAVTKADIHHLEEAIIEKLSMKLAALLKPIKGQLEGMKAAQAETKKIADCTMELALANQDSTRAIQYDPDNLRQKVLTMEMESRIFKVKLCGIPEQAETSTDLQILVSTWMASVLHLESNIASCLMRVRRIGALGHSKRQAPRDIVATFLDMREKSAFMREARQQGCFRFQGERVEVYQDLPPEALTLRGELKPITHQLQLASRKYRWIGPAKIQVIHKGNAITATEYSAGFSSHRQGRGVLLLEHAGCA